MVETILLGIPKTFIYLVNVIQCDGNKTTKHSHQKGRRDLCMFYCYHIPPPIPPAAGIPAETREAGCLKHEVTVDTAALNYMPPTNQNPHAVTVFQSPGRI